ncbi:Six-hairpin glycosidase-like protein [Aspergillus pseudotamarii]|uniref:Six-hairpin glycosidase-like protein n=1 Tax=Aspergillus pseudotamarii TaxID=132259 RepID=A0A5N6S8S7_ASPPS|nr:Six-hairpin glycosidase-like protein [Aspergillus pseudotamarii]KAE8131042.1 Six-hairpin glycosidase-like protein [Aspergillus pseudotamarii]
MSVTETIIERHGLMSSPEAAGALLSKSTPSPHSPLSSEVISVGETGNGHCLDVDVSRSVPNLREHLADLFAENILAKVWRVACESLPGADASPEERAIKFPRAFPEYVPQNPQHGEKPSVYHLREADFWTCGFFPGTLYELLERTVRYPQSTVYFLHSSPQERRDQLRAMCEKWSEPLHNMASRTDTHDIGFIVMPALRKDWELFGNSHSLASIVRAAKSLATRYVASAKAIRSWDLLIRKDTRITDMRTNLIVIIDSLCNLDLLFYAAAHSSSGYLAEIAVAHARTVIRTHLRPEPHLPQRTVGRYKGQLYSTNHVTCIDPKTGDIKRRMTAQGYGDGSTWARGQAWAILGYAQTYTWTGDREFLEVACGTAEYFLDRLETHPVARGPGGGRMQYTSPPWDFDAPMGENDSHDVVRDSSAAAIAANGLLLLSQALIGNREISLATRFFDAAVQLIRGTLDYSLARETARFRCVPGRNGEELKEGLAVEDVVQGKRFDAILKHGTANNNENARRRYANHGLVYGDYYLVRFGNELMRMGLV